MGVETFRRTLLCLGGAICIAVLCSQDVLASTVNLSPSKIGYITNNTVRWLGSPIRVGFKDNTAPLNNTISRGFVWFNVPSAVQNGVITNAEISAYIFSGWGDTLYQVELRSLATLTQSGFDALGNNDAWNRQGSGRWLHDQKKPFSGSTIKFQIVAADDLDYAFYGSSVGFSLVAYLEDPGGGWGDDTNETYLTNFQMTITYEPECEVPSPPTGVSATDGIWESEVLVIWNMVTKATDYEVWRNTGSSSSSAQKIWESPYSDKYDDTSATPERKYYYWIKAKNSCGTSNFSSYNTGYRKLAYPTGVSASDGTYTDKVRVTWNSVSGATSYTVYRATSSGGNQSSLGSTSGTTYDDTSASVGTTYYYRLKALNSYGDSDHSGYDRGYRGGTAPLPPTGVSASDGTYTDKVRVTWDSNGATLYTVYRATSSGGSKSSLGSTSGTTYDDTSASVGTTSYYWVKASNSHGTSGYSSYNTGYPGGTAPLPPTGVSASDGTYTDKVRVTWNSNGATSYTIYRATSSGGSKSSLGSTSSTTYDDTSASVGTTYYYWVKASNSHGTSGYSSYNTGYPGGTTPSAPTGVSASDGTYTDKVRVTWNSSNGATNYSIVRGTSVGTGGAAIGETSGTSFDDTTATAGTTYYYYVVAENGNGNSGLSDYDTGYKAVASVGVPSNFNASQGTYPDKVRLTFSRGANAHSTMVYRNTIDDSGTATQLSSGTPWNYYNDTTVETGKTYYYWVKGAGYNGTSDFSDSAMGWAGTRIETPPVFDVTIDLNNVPIEICFIPNLSLNANPIVTLETGNGITTPTSGSTVSPITDPCSNLSIYCIYYDNETDNETVRIRIEETDPVISGDTGSEVAEFVVDFDHDRATSFCVYAGEDGGGSLLDNDCGTDDLSIEIDNGDLAGLGADCNSVTITEIDYVTVPAPPDTSVAMMCDISLPDGVEIANGQTVTVTLSFTLTDGSTRSDYDNGSKAFEVLYYDDGTNPGPSGWKSDGITFNYPADVQWTNNTSGTITFETDHFTTFVPTSKSIGGGGGGGGSNTDGGTQAESGGGGGGGGCSITPIAQSIPIVSAVANILILLFPLIIFGIRRR